MDKLSPSKLQDLKACFSVFDRDQNGKISPDELSLLFTALQNPVESHEELMNIFRAVDTDGDGFIGLNEFYSVLAGKGLFDADTQSFKDADNVEALKKTFEVFDKDGNGLITAEELTGVLISMGHDINEKTCKATIESVASRPEGGVTFDGFVKLMAPPSTAEAEAKPQQ
ncbi:EF-hand [Ramicandelaber brevisporus]|nr:EF-hand [Ramicandelaber brevisporus]